MTTLTWTHFFSLALILLLLFIVLRFLQEIFRRFDIMGQQHQATALRIIHRILLIYELLVVLILGAAFVLISPFMHGLIVGALFLGAFPHIRNYICGRVIQFDRGVQVGNRLKHGDTSGTIATIQRVGLKLRTGKGLRFINYSKLLSEGYLLLAGDDIGGFYRLQIKPQEVQENINYQDQLLNVLHSTPYLNWQHRPIIKSIEDNGQMDARVVLKEEKHLPDLVSLLEEWGYIVRMKKA